MRRTILLSLFALGAVSAVFLGGSRLRSQDPVGAEDNPFGNPAAQQQQQPPAQPAGGDPTGGLQQIVQQGNVHHEPVKTPEPVALSEKEHHAKGWQLSFPGKRPLATPAVVDGKVFVGGGFGSHEFYAFDGTTGKLAWQYVTKDDGPTAAVVDDGYVVFNTESCELEVLTIDGKPVWKRWLGDPLMSMPAIADGKVYMCYPDSRGDHEHYLACFELKSGKELWKQAIAGEVITAPVVAEKHVYLASLEGTAYCFDQRSGERVWQEPRNVTSSPVVWNGECFFSRRAEMAVEEKGSKVLQQMESIARRKVAKSETVTDIEVTRRKADYLDFSKRQLGSALEARQQSADASVGFGGAMKGSAKISQAIGNLGKGSVCAVWSYQGSKPIIHEGRLYAAMGDTLECIDPATNKVLWKQALHDPSAKQHSELLDTILTPPAIVNGKLFLGTAYGDVVVLDADTGKELRRVKLGETILFQPAVVAGRIYVSSNHGTLYCIETDDARDDGWKMWGATAAHNGI